MINLYDAYKMTLIEKFVHYVIDSRYRKSVNLKYWLKKQVDNPTKLVKMHSEMIPSRDNYETQAIEVLRYVKKTITYKTDYENWGMNEKWETADEVLQRRIADCESGALLIYILCRLKGIPANRLKLFAGWVQSSDTAPKGGHCWLGFMTTYYGEQVFLDWCYYPNLKYISQRDKHYIQKKEIISFDGKTDLQKEGKYKSIWFAFNENISTTRF